MNEKGFMQEVVAKLRVMISKYEKKAHMTQFGFNNSKLQSKEEAADSQATGQAAGAGAGAGAEAGAGAGAGAGAKEQRDIYK